MIRALAAAGVPDRASTPPGPSVAAAALAAGAVVVNDVSGGLADPAMARVVADAGCPWVLMHWRGHSAGCAELAVYDDVVDEVREELRARVDAAVAAGVRRGPDHPRPRARLREDGRAQLAARRPSCDELVALGFPVLFGASRKSYLGALLADAGRQPRPVDEREAATVATSVLAVAAGAWGVRVHDVRGTVDALAVWRATGRPRWRRTDDATAIMLPGCGPAAATASTTSSGPQGQDFVVDVGPRARPARRPPRSDDVADTVHYGELAERLVAVVTGEPVNLIETLAERLADVCLADARVAAATVTVHKPQAPIPHEFADVAVTVRRTRDDR